MKKNMFVIAFMATLIVALFAAGAVSAKGNSPAVPQTPATGTGYGRGGGMGEINLDGVLHDSLIAIYAQELGIPVAELEARLDSGETLADIAAAAGLTPEQFAALMSDARIQALDQAVIDGILTQEQADWLKTRMGGQMDGQATGQATGQVSRRSARGTGLGERGTMAQDCPMVTP